MRDQIEIKTPDQIRAMRRAGLVVADALSAVREATAPGVTTGELDEVAAAVIADAGARPSFLGYNGYPATICTSVGPEVVHGIPGDRELVEGDVLSVDCGAIVDGWHGDAAWTAVVGAGRAGDIALVEDCRAAMWAGIAAAARHGRLNDIGAAVEAEAASRRSDYGIIEEYVGHGIGTAMHMSPEVLNYRSRARGPRLRPGVCLAIEPMVVRGDIATKILADEWTVVTLDGANAAHWEHTVALTPGGIWVLTAHDGGRAELEALGAPYAPLAG